MYNSTRAFWVVSPNVSYDEGNVGDWRQVSVKAGAAFMGWGADDPKHANMGPKFAGRTPNGIKPGDVILIARRKNREPQCVGFGVVDGPAQTELPGHKLPGEFGSLRKLKPFVAWSRPPSEVPFSSVVTHIRALVQLHPESKANHKLVCDWMMRKLSRRGSTVLNQDPAQSIASTEIESNPSDETVEDEISVVSSQENRQLDYEVRSPAEVRRAQKIEAQLLARYKVWLGSQDRNLQAVRYGGLRCDGYEVARRNLLEAKSSAKREYIRMAVGQLLDYAYQGLVKFGDPNKAILLPSRPDDGTAAWLCSIGISVVWQDGVAFLDNANGQFT
jgi:hypothetical protein